MYLLIARLRRMARPRRYSTVSTKTENEAKRRAITPSTMAVVACLMTDEKEEGHIILSADTEWKLFKRWPIKRSNLPRNVTRWLNTVSNPWTIAPKHKAQKRGTFEINTKKDTNSQRERESSPNYWPLGTVDVAWFTAALLVWVFKNDSLASHQALRAGGDTVWAVLHAGTCYTLISSL